MRNNKHGRKFENDIPLHQLEFYNNQDVSREEVVHLDPQYILVHFHQASTQTTTQPLNIGQQETLSKKTKWYKISIFVLTFLRVACINS